MKHKLLPQILLLIILSSSTYAQVTIDYNQTVASRTDTVDFTNGFSVNIINVPEKLPGAIAINDGGGLINLAIRQNDLNTKYSAALTTIGGHIAIELKIAGGKIIAPFSTANISQPLTFQFNGKSCIITSVQAAPPAVGVGQTPQTPGSLPADYSPGMIYYDAIELSQLLNAKSASAWSIVAAYGITTTNITKDQFLSDAFSSLKAVEVGNSLTLSSALSAVGNIDVTNFADGLAKFLVERAKEELNVAFFSNFQKFINSYPEVATIFPSTYDFLKNINSYQYAAMLPTLRAGFQKDLNGLCGNIITLRTLTSASSTCTSSACKERVDALNDLLNKTQIGRSIIGSLVLTNSIIKGNNIAVAINDLATDPVCQVPDTSNFYNIANAIGLLNLLSQSLISKDKGNIWVTRQQINDLLSNTTTLEIYLGLLYAKDAKNSTHVSFKSSSNTLTLQNYLNLLEPQMKNATAVFNSFKNNFQQLANAVDDANNNIKNIASVQSQNNPSSILLYANYASSITNVVTQAVNLLPNDITVFGNLSAVKNDISIFTAVINDAVNCSYDIKSQNYGALVLHTSDLLAKILGDKYAFKDNYIKYGTFMTNIVQAKNSDEVNAAIDAAVLPVGSASIKRQTQFNIAVNAFIGPEFGWEYLPELKSNRWSQVFGLSAPVGVAFSLGNVWGDEQSKPDAKGKTKGGKSLSLFVSLIDVGALASYRLQNDSSSVSSEIKLQNIVSPGLFLYYGFGKTPISLGFGAQYGPELRSISPGGIGDINQNYYIKYGFSLVVDIPLFNLYTKSKE